MVEKYKNFNEIFPDTDIITGIDESKIPYKSGEEIFGEELTPSTDAALAKYAYGDPDMEIGEESLLDPKLRGRISAADTINEKIAEFKKAYPEGDLLFVPGKGTAQSTLEGVPSKYSGGEILFRPDSTTPYARLDGNYFKGGSKEFLADFAEFIYDDLGVISGELAAGSKKVAKFIKPFTKPVPFLGTLTTGYDLLPLMTRMGLYGAAGELAQEGVQELRGINEQSFKDIASPASSLLFKIPLPLNTSPIFRAIGSAIPVPTKATKPLYPAVSAISLKLCSFTPFNSCTPSCAISPAAPYNPILVINERRS